MRWMTMDIDCAGEGITGTIQSVLKVPALGKVGLLPFTDIKDPYILNT
jgi:hypothetical protein